MSASKPQRKRTVLTEDGELRDDVSIDAAPLSAQTAPLYCIHCGSANRSEARFCRKCGQPLDDQDIDHDHLPDRTSLSGEKRKRLKVEPSQMPQHMPFAAMVTGRMVLLQAFTLIFVGIMMIATLAAGFPIITVCVLIAWFMVEMAWSGALK